MIMNPIILFTEDISSEGLMRIYSALKFAFNEANMPTPNEKVAVKLSTGENKSNYLRPALIKQLVDKLQGTIVECNTAYEGPRHNSYTHLKLAQDHGFTKIAPFDIQDAISTQILPINKGHNIVRNIVGGSFFDYDYYAVLSHFKGHQMAGFGGAIKNISIGLASADGKVNIHTAGNGGDIFDGEQIPFLESMAEAALSVVEALHHRLLYINVLNRISIDCDCNFNPAEPEIEDIGIVAAFDPVAIDRCCIDLVSQAEGNKSLLNRINEQQGLHLLDYAESIGLGTNTYQLVDIDTIDV